MTNPSLADLSDSDLLLETVRAAEVERRSTGELIALLAEVDLRKLYLGRGYSSLFIYCTKALRLSESAAYARITAARASRSFPNILTYLVDGSMTLTTVSLLVGHLTGDNHEALLTAARNKSRREVEVLVASLHSQPDVVSSVRRLPDSSRSITQPEPSSQAELLDSVATPAAPVLPRPGHRSVIAPLGPKTHLLRVTLSAQGHQRLERARALLRHQIPGGDPAEIVERALQVLVDQLERTKHARTPAPRKTAETVPSRSRHVPAAVKREVWARDRGQCAFVGADGRCTEAGFLEYHHVVPFAAGGATDSHNLELRCRAHNAYEVTLIERSSRREARPVESAGAVDTQIAPTAPWKTTELVFHSSHRSLPLR